MVLEKHRKGDLTESIIVAELKERNIPVSKPFGDNEPYDLIVQTPDETLLRIQVKTGRYVDGSVRFDGFAQHRNTTGSTWETYRGAVDYFIVYSHRFETLYLIDADRVNSRKYLRIEDAKADHPSINWASEFEFDRVWPPGTFPEPVSGPDEIDLPPHRRGDATEAWVIAELLRRDLPIAIPPTDNERFDLLLGTSRGKFYKIQIKTGWCVDGCVTFRSASSHVNAEGVVIKPYVDDIDYFLVFEPTREEMYLLAEDSLDTSIFLRVDDSKRPDRTAHQAADYLFDRNWPPENPEVSVHDEGRPCNTEIRDIVIEALSDLDATVSEPTGDAPFDFLVEASDRGVYRCEVRAAQTRDGRIIFQPDVDGEAQCDYYLLYGYDAEKTYLINSSIVESPIALWVDEPKLVRRSTIRARDYELTHNWPPSSGDRIRHTILIDEARKAFADLGVETAYPAGEAGCDILAESGPGRFHHVGVEPGWISNGRIRLKPDSKRGIDCFLLVCRELDTTYLVDADEFEVSISLRIVPPKQDHATVNNAEDYALASRWPIESSSTDDR